MYSLNINEKCKLIRDYLETEQARINEFTNLLLTIGEVTENEVLDKQVSKVFSALQRANGSLQSMILSVKDTSGFTSCILKPTNIVYDGSNGWSTVVEGLNVTTTITDVIGKTWSNYIVGECRASNLADAISSRWHFGTTTVDFDLVIQIGDTESVICHCSGIVGGEMTITNINNDSAKLLAKAYSSAAYANENVELYSLVANACAQPTPNVTGLISALQKYLQSGFSDVRRTVSTFVNDSLISATAVINRLFSKFKNKYKYEVVDGVIVWGEQDVTNTDYLPWSIIVSGVSAIVGTVGTVLVYAGGIIAKIVGAVLLVASTIVQAIMSTTAQVAGTTPTVATNAAFPAYCDYIYYKHFHIPFNANVDSNAIMESKSKYMSLNRVLTTDNYQILSSQGCLCIKTLPYIIFIYDYYVDEDRYENFNVKIFPTCCIDYVTHANLPHTFDYGTVTLMKQLWPNKINDDYAAIGWPFFMTSEGPGDKFRSFSCAAYGDSSSYENWQYISVSDAVSFANRFIEWSAPVLQPLDLIDTAWSYEKWDRCGGSIVNSISIIGFLLGSLGCHYCVANPVDQYNVGTILCDSLPFSGEVFSGSIQTSIDLLRHLSDDNRPFYGLLMLAKDVTIYNLDNCHVSVKPYFTKKNGNTYDQFSLTRAYEIGNVGGFDAKAFSFSMDDLQPMVVAPARSGYALLGISIGAAAIAVTIAASVMVAKSLVKYKLGLKHATRMRDLADDLASFDLTEEEMKQLSPEDLKEYQHEWKLSQKKLKKFNFLSKLFGLTTYDWRNEWVEVPEVSDTSTSLALQSTVASVSDFMDTLNANGMESESNTALSQGSTEIISSRQVDLDNVTLRDIALLLIGNSESWQPQVDE